MKKFLHLIALPLVLAACQGMGTGTMKGDNAGAPSEESLNGTMSNEYSDTGVETATASEGSNLVYAGPKYYIGVPYKIGDTEYSPAEDWTYNQTGIAGIVPVDLDGVSTSNGEKFDVNAMVATSKTLPLPSIVRITNLDSGMSAVVRVNNRGPFVNNRLMDVSPAVARKLGMTGQTKVQVQLMPTESQKVKDLTVGTVAPVADAPDAMTVSSGPYTVQVGAYYSEDSAKDIAKQVASLGTTAIVEEGGMFKVRFTGLSAESARKTIDSLQNEMNMERPGLLKDGNWVNINSI